MERSNISNWFYGSARPTGVLVSASRGGIDWTAGVLSTDSDEMLAQWDDALAYYVSASFAAGNGRVTLDGVYNDFDPATDQEDEIGYEWGISAAYETKIGNWDFMANALYGETHGGEAVYGLVLMPSTFLIEDKLEAVFRYQYAGSDGENISISRRNVNNVHRHDRGFSIPAGDENHTLYVGLNYYLCDHNAKIMVGAEYETLDGIRPAGANFDLDADALTFWAAFRMYF